MIPPRRLSLSVVVREEEEEDMIRPSVRLFEFAFAMFLAGKCAQPLFEYDLRQHWSMEREGEGSSLVNCSVTKLNE